MTRTKEETKPLTLENLMQREQADKVRKAYNSGRREIGIDGRLFKITKFTRNVTFMADGEVKRASESWLSLRPVNGDLVPCANIEFKHEGNMRTARSKS